MARAMWSGSVQIGLIIFPVKLYTAAEKREVELHLVHSGCGTRIQQKRWCPTHEAEIAWGDVDRGYEVTKGQVVTLTDEDLSSLPIPTAKTIEVLGFIGDKDAPGPLYELDNYYMTPQDVGQKPMALIMSTMLKKRRLAIGRVALRQRERLCLLRPMEDGRMVMTLLRWSDEVRDEDVYHTDLGQKFPKAEADLALDLVSSLEPETSLDQHEDSYRKELNRIIEAKVNSSEIVQQPIPEPTPIKGGELLEALSRTIEEGKATKAKKKKAS